MNLNLMDPKLIAVVVIAVLVIIIAAALYIRKRKNTTAGLRNRFGPEYDRAVKQNGSERKAEAKLADRKTRVELLRIRNLELTELERYLAQWQALQSRFVDYPKGAVTEADELVSSLMQARGYAVSDFDQRLADISVGPSPSSGELSLGSQHRVAPWPWRSQHGRASYCDDPLSLTVRRTSTGADTCR